MMDDKDSLQLAPVPRVETISKNVFSKKYVNPQQPVVIEHLVDHWPATKKWDLDYIKQVAGEKVVPLYNDRPLTADQEFNKPHTEMDRIQKRGSREKNASKKISQLL